MVLREPPWLAVLAWRQRCPIALCSIARMVSAAASSYLSRHCPAAASGSTEGLGDPRASRLSLHLSLLLDALETFPPVDWYGVRDGALRSKTFAFFAVCSWGPRSGCLGPHGGEGVRTCGRLHPGQAGERLLEQRPHATTKGKSATSLEASRL